MSRFAIGSKGAAHPSNDFRPDIEGLRGIAVLLVVLFHAHIPGFDGGFFGVDIFYVISGYLITGLLMRELGKSGTISIRNFYARRARRLLPAASVTLLATLVAAYFLSPKILVPGFSFDIASAALFLSNFNFAHHATDYFANTSPSPVLHFWSLSVEEQYYLIWPGLALLIGRSARNLQRRFALFLGITTLASFAFALWLLTQNASWAFFSLPSRAWELAIGGFAAALTAGIRGKIKFAATYSYLGLGLVIASTALLRSNSAFPGWPALLPTIATCLLLVGGVKNNLASAFIANPILRYLGKISYSLYLWHWPVLILASEQRDKDLSLTERALLVLLTLAISVISYHLIEAPLRNGRLIGKVPARNLAFAALTISLVAGSATFADLHLSAKAKVHKASASAKAAALSTLVQKSAAATISTTPTPLTSISASPSATPTPTKIASPSATKSVAIQVMAKPSSKPSKIASAVASAIASSPAAGTPAPANSNTTSVIGLPLTGATRSPTVDSKVPADLAPSLDTAGSDRAITYSDRCHTQQNLPPSTKPCLYGDLKSNKLVVLFGDSHALSWFPALNEIATNNHWKLLSLTMSACNPADMPMWDPTAKIVMKNCALWRTQSIARIQAANPYAVVVTGTRGFVTVDANNKVLTGDAKTAVYEAGMNKTLLALKQATPRVVLVSDIPISNFDPKVCLSKHPKSTLACATPVGDAISNSWENEEVKVAQAANVQIIDPAFWICPTSPCPVTIGSILIYLDAGHLTATFSEAIAPLFDSALSDALRKES